MSYAPRPKAPKPNNVHAGAPKRKISLPMVIVAGVFGGLVLFAGIVYGVLRWFGLS